MMYVYVLTSRITEINYYFFVDERKLTFFSFERHAVHWLRVWRPRVDLPSCFTFAPPRAHAFILLHIPAAKKEEREVRIKVFVSGPATPCIHARASTCMYYILDSFLLLVFCSSEGTVPLL